jgi:hypothetical protein
MTCDHCGRESSTPTCDVCLGYQSWASSSHGDHPARGHDSRRAKKLGQARADLSSLPDMLDELSRCLTERGGQSGGGKPSKVSGSPAPLRLDVLHLVDERRKAGWHGEDPRSPRWALNWTWRDEDYSKLYPTKEAAENAMDMLDERINKAHVSQWKPQDVYGAAALLESWTRIVNEEMAEPPDMAEVASARSEASVLIEVWDWVEDQAWGEELADDVIALGRRVRNALGVKREPKFACIKCGNRAYLRFGDNFLVCEEGHEVSVRELEEQQRRRPAVSIEQIMYEFGVSRERIYGWTKRKQVTPMEGSRPMKLFPWDVILLVNPDLADAIKIRDEELAAS